MEATVEVGLSALIVAVTDEAPRVMTVHKSGKAPALPYGPLEPRRDRTLELALRRWVADLTGLQLGYAEQLYTFGDRDRGGAGALRRIVSVAYLALVREHALRDQQNAEWRDIYSHLPWEDWRSGVPGELSHALDLLEPWAADHAERQHRLDIAFGRGDMPWDEERVLERYEILYEAGLVEEARVDAPEEHSTSGPTLLGTMKHDHRRMLASAFGRLRGKLKYRPVVFQLLPERFTLLQLQRLVEALAGVRLHKQNFRRLVTRGGLVEGTGELDRQTGGRPAELFQFRRDVVRERPAPGVGLPGKGAG